MKKIFEEIEKKLTLKNKLKFFCYSYPKRKVKRKIIASLLLIISFFAIVGGVYYLHTLIGNSAFVGGLGGMAILGWRFFDVIKKPITAEMLSDIEKKEGKEELGLTSKIREDINFLNNFFENKLNTKIIIFVDNLDRCPDDTSVDVLESVSLLLNITCFIIILGVEEEILHNATNLRYKRLFGEHNTAETASRIDFLDKIVQIPFYIPRPDDEFLKKYVTSLIGLKEDKAERRGNTKSEDTTPRPLEDTEDEQKQFKDWSEYLPKNPRKVKRLINIYRLVKILASNKGRSEFINNTGNQSKLLIKWLIICEQWPDFVKKIDLKSNLTSTLEEYKKDKKENRTQEKVKTLEDFINKDPVLEVKIYVRI